MGLTSQSTGAVVLGGELKLEHTCEEKIIALGGNPNVGKSTVFNSLTGLNQHTGNWPGKTVSSAQGKCRHKDTNFILVDIPGTYSLMSSSEEEEIARDFICFGNPDTTVIVTDATCLERNLNLVLQTLEITSEVVVCVNLLDEAKRKKISINLEHLSELLGVPVIGTSARSNQGLNLLMDAVYEVTKKAKNNHLVTVTYEDSIEDAIALLVPTLKKLLNDKLNSRWVALKLLDKDDTIIASINKHLGLDLMSSEELKLKLIEAKNELKEAGIDQEFLSDKVVSQIVSMAEKMGKEVITYEATGYNQMDRKIDRVLTSKRFGIPLMVVLLGVVFWITITGANYPSSMISTFLFWIESRLTVFCQWIGAPSWVNGLFVTGIFRTLAWVISVMLPPMAIFFPLFTLLEDLGYLPRVAFNLDNYFKKACAHGKQSLTMCMGKQDVYMDFVH